jgi:hypothetical protein
MRFTRGFGDGIIILERPEKSTGLAASPPPRTGRQPAPPWQRSPPTSRDVTLSSMAAAWRERFTPDLRPITLCRRYPRIANRLALCWDDRTLTAKVFHDLLVDRRGNRRGFPPEVQRELIALRDQTAG